VIDFYLVESLSDFKFLKVDRSITGIMRKFGQREKCSLLDVPKHHGVSCRDAMQLRNKFKDNEK